MKVFLGGTCNNSKWREELIPQLKIDYFNPVVEDWTPECQAEEIKQRQKCDFCLYTITPEMTGVYSIAEVVDDSNKRPEKTVFCLLEEYGGKSFNKHQIKSLHAVAKLVLDNGGAIVNSLVGAAVYLNTTTPKLETSLITQISTGILGKHQDDSLRLQALVEAGVDNWDGYSEAMKIYESYK